MKRKAILIESSNVAGQTDLPGARVDIENWRSYLTSELGGLWAPSEIVTLHKPLSTDVKKEMEVDRDVYVFVAFSGHGSEGSVCLNDFYAQFPIANLKPKTQRGVTVIDACRGIDVTAVTRIIVRTALNEATVPPSRKVATNAQTGKVTNFSAPESLIKKAEISHRDVWGHALARSGTGTVEMFACARGQAAGENPNAGGYYTSLLLQSAVLWEQVKSTEKVHSTKDAHDHAAKQMPPQQTPVYAPTSLAFPFAVRL